MRTKSKPRTDDLRDRLLARLRDMAERWHASTWDTKIRQLEAGETVGDLASYLLNGIDPDIVTRAPFVDVLPDGAIVPSPVRAARTVPSWQR